MHENSGIQFLGELSHNKMKSLGKFNVEAKLRGVPNEVRLMSSYANWEKPKRRNVYNDYQDILCISICYAEAKKLKINLLFSIGYTILDTFYSKFARRMKMITQFYM